MSQGLSKAQFHKVTVCFDAQLLRAVQLVSASGTTWSIPLFIAGDRSHKRHLDHFGTEKRY